MINDPWEWYKANNLKPKFRYKPHYGFALIHPDGWAPEARLSYCENMNVAIQIAKHLPPDGVGLRKFFKTPYCG
jgi:hypothetical protein